MGSGARKNSDRPILLTPKGEGSEVDTKEDINELCPSEFKAELFDGTSLPKGTHLNIGQRGQDHFSSFWSCR